MRPHYRSLSETKQQYRRMFHEARGRLEARLLALRMEAACPACDATSPLPGRGFEDIKSGCQTVEASEAGIESWLGARHEGCGYRAFQRRALAMLENEVGREIFLRLQAVDAYRNSMSCHMCGMCCRLASSEFSYEQLQARAAAGDDFARQFTSVFLPYESREAAQRKFPDVVAAVLAEAGEALSRNEAMSGGETADMLSMREKPDYPEIAEATNSENTPVRATAERVFFYHCPYIGEDNRCTVYGTARRPAICASYPETPLSFVYEKCAWRGWKDETHGDALAAHAMMELALHWSSRLRRALAD